MYPDTIIIGGGVIGCSIALRLARGGQKVTLIERGTIGCEASHAAAGMLSPQAEAEEPGPFFDLCLESRQLYPDFAASLKEQSGIDIEYRSEGTLVIALEDEAHEDPPAWSGWQRQAGLPLEVLDQRELPRLEPLLTPHAVGALYLAGDHQVDNRKLMAALAVAIKRAGVHVVEGSTVQALEVLEGRVDGVVLPCGTVKTGAVVLAAGALSGRMMLQAGIPAEIIPAKGQMLALRHDSIRIEHVLYSRGCYLVPRSDNRILVGSTVEYVGFQKTVTAAGIKSLLDAALKLIPALGSSDVVEIWAGLRPDTLDHLPILGPTGIQDLILATGHFRNGILLAPITAELIFDSMVTGKRLEQVQHFSVERFNQRSPERGHHPHYSTRTR